MKAPFVIVLSLTFGVVLLGLATLHRDLLVLAIPLMVYLFAAIFQRPEAVKLVVAREVFPDYAPQGAPITISLSVTNEGAALDELAVQDVLPRGTKQIEGKSFGAAYLATQASLALEYTIAAERGAYERYEVRVSRPRFSRLLRADARLPDNAAFRRSSPLPEARSNQNSPTPNARLRRTDRGATGRHRR